jgi:hypothetical protein
MGWARQALAVVAAAAWAVGSAGLWAPVAQGLLRTIHWQPVACPKAQRLTHRLARKAAWAAVDMVARAWAQARGWRREAARLWPPARCLAALDGLGAVDSAACLSATALGRDSAEVEAEAGPGFRACRLLAQQGLAAPRWAGSVPGSAAELAAVQPAGMGLPVAVALPATNRSTQARSPPRPSRRLLERRLAAPAAGRTLFLRAVGQPLMVRAGTVAPR